MTLNETLYLAMILILFFSFMAMLLALSWLDAKDAKVRRRRALAATRATQH